VLLSVISNPWKIPGCKSAESRVTGILSDCLAPLLDSSRYPRNSHLNNVCTQRTLEKGTIIIKPETYVYPRLLRTWGLGRNIYSVTKFLHLRRPYLSSSPLVLCTVRITLTCTFVPFSRSLPIAHASFISPLWLALGANIPLMFVRYQTGDFMFRVTKLPLMTIVHVTDSIPFSVARSI
jgi:hypothetical protein